MAFCLAVCLSIEGCGARELQLFTIATAIGIDRGEKGYAVTIEGSGEVSESIKVTKPSVEKGEGETVTLCLSDIRKKGGRYPYLRHSVLLLISMDAAEESLENLLEYVINEHNFRLSTYVAVAEGEAGSMFSDEKYESQRIVRSLSKGATTVTTAEVMLADLIYDVYSPGIDAFLPMVKEDETEGIVFFNGFKPAGTLDGRLTPAFLMSKGIIHSGNMTVEIDGVPCSFKLTTSHSDRKVTVENGRAVLDIQVKARFRSEDRPDSIAKAEKALEERLTGDIKEMTDMLRESKSDALGFGQILYRHHNGLWREIEHDWPRLYSESAVRISVKAEVDGAPEEEKR